MPVHAMLIAMLRANPTLIVDNRPVQARRGGDLAGPNPTTRGKRGTKHHVAINGDGTRLPAPPRRPACLTRPCSNACSRHVCGRGPDCDRLCGPRHRRRGLPHPVPQLRGQAAHPQTASAAWLRSGRALLSHRAHQRLAAGERASRPALRPARLHREISAPVRLPLPGRRKTRPGISKTAFKPIQCSLLLRAGNIVTVVLPVPRQLIHHNASSLVG